MNTIFAVSSGKIKAGVAVIRISGRGAAQAFFALGFKDLPEPRKAVFAKLTNNNEIIDQALCLWFPAPRSFTGEDTAEFHIHGSIAVIENITNVLSKIEGFRIAEPGEFSKRAFENGKMDLVQAEGLADLIEAETSAQSKQALRAMEGEASKIYDDWRTRIIEIMAFIEAYIDFPDENIPHDLDIQAQEKVAAIISEINLQIANNAGERIRNGAVATILGAPNVGKSTLINFLSKRELAIVSEIAGTTRDFLEAHLNIEGLLAEFGEKRVIDTPITEHGFAGLGVGAAFAGLKPVVEFMTWNFAMQAIDQIINSAAKTNYMSGGQVRCPIVFRGPNGAAARVGAQHSQCYASWYAHCPGLIVIAPWDAASSKGLLKAAIRNPNPVIFLENEISYGKSYDVPEDESYANGDYTVEIGEAKIVRAGTDVTITAFSLQVEMALAAAEQLAEEGIEAEVIDLRTIRPLDKETIINSVRKTSRLVAVEEGFPFAGIAAEISAMINEEAFDDLDAPVERVTGVDVPLPYAANLEKLALPQVQNIIDAAKRACYRKI